ncbi:MAG: hypothetical protein KY453_10740 [Gemmatimonadetes bacterium]|nr:hypothetical protein [Gemmatimonadota bacterium]
MATGLVAGAVAGTVVALAVVVGRATFTRVYLHAPEDVVGWPLVAAILVALLGAVLGAVGRIAAPVAGAAEGLPLGTIAGALLGAAVTSNPTGPWAGAVMGAGAGVLLGGALAPSEPGFRLAGVARAVRRRIPRPVGAVLAALLVAGVAAGGVATCRQDDVPLAPPGALPAPDTSEVASVVIFVGDAGEGTLATHPVLVKLRDDVERWSAGLGPGGEVVVVFLGDIVYPDGLHPPDAPEWPRDSLIVAHQVAAVEGPGARRGGARAIFVAGNHDWGLRRDWEGAVRLARLEAFFAARRQRGVRVSLEPRAGTGGPSVVDVGERLRLVLLDTAWWLLGAEPEEEEEVLAGVEAALAGAEGRAVVMAAHHPFVSAGPHGALLQWGESLGLRTLLARSGAMLQDLYSQPYRRLLRGLVDVFGRTGPPALFAGGHEHSLQVVRTEEPDVPPVSVVSGSASKLTRVGKLPGLTFGRSAPGYAILLARHDGELELRVDAAPARFLACAEEGGPPGSGAGGAGEGDCMAEALQAFRTVWMGPV